MSGPFKVGEFCIGQNFVNALERNGMECQITAPLEERLCHRPWSPNIKYRSETYLVRWADGENTAVEQFQLRRKQPPSSAKAIMRAAILKAKQPQEVEA